MLLYPCSVKIQELGGSLNSPKSSTSYTQLQKFLHIGQIEFIPCHEKQHLRAIAVNLHKTELFPLTVEKITLLSQKLSAECLYVWFTKFCLVFKTQIFRKYLYTERQLQWSNTIGGHQRSVYWGTSLFQKDLMIPKWI